MRLGHEQLGDARIGQSRHAHLVALDPVLRRHRLDHVVAVEQLQRLEEVVGAAGTAGSAHVHAHRGVAHQGRDQCAGIRRRIAQHRQGAAQRGVVANGLTGSGGIVAGVIHDRGVRSLFRRTGQRDVSRELGTVAHRDVVRARHQGLRIVEVLARFAAVDAHHRVRPGLFRGRSVDGLDEVAAARRDVTEHQAAPFVRGALGNELIGIVVHAQLLTFRRVRHEQLLHARLHRIAGRERRRTAFTSAARCAGASAAAGQRLTQRFILTASGNQHHEHDGEGETFHGAGNSAGCLAGLQRRRTDRHRPTCRRPGRLLLARGSMRP